ncbi:hypothetical protein IFR05_001099 [Cadophora sp. M221]|nr:hypothetical protein IFR05_001099 [Cadophora sp. M221]
MATTNLVTAVDVQQRSSDTSHEPTIFFLSEMNAEFSSGLDIVTRAIFNSTKEFTVSREPQKPTFAETGTPATNTPSSIRGTNVSLANLVRDACQKDGWLAGWKCLSQVAPDCGLHEQFIKDTVTCAEIYSRIRVSPYQSTPIDMLGTVDYDFDLEAAHHAGFANSLEEASRNVVKAGSNIQGGAMAALLNSDLQHFVRSVQMEWVQEAAGSYILGPKDVSVDEWVKANALDCAAIMGFGYQDPSRHAISRKGVFVGNLLANMHDSLYDMGCSSRMSTVLYARGAGVEHHDIHRATAAVSIACFDNIARRNNEILDRDTPYYGDCMGIMAFSWSAFNGRYRTWERFVKYSRQLKNSESMEAKAILGDAEKCLMFVEDSRDADMATTWQEALAPDGAKKLTERQTFAYIPPPGHEILDTPGVKLPDICKSCDILFRDAIDATDDEVHGIPGLQKSVSSCRALGLAAAIRRASVFAASDSCCDICACRIGNWGDSVAYRVMVMLMKSEEETSPREWLLQHYLVACVDFWPVSVPSILAGFDMIGGLKYDNGAMGIRDVVDC